MDNKEMIQKVRKYLDSLDDKLVQIMQERMALVDAIAEAKRAENMPTADESREEQIIKRVLDSAKDEYKGETVTFIRTILGLSKFRQRKLLFDRILCCHRREPAAKDITIAYQGLPGAWGEQ